MYPNTFMMQEYVRRYFDEFLDRVEDGQKVETPRIYTIQKGMLATSHLQHSVNVVPVQEPRSRAI